MGIHAEKHLRPFGQSRNSPGPAKTNSSFKQKREAGSSRDNETAEFNNMIFEPQRLFPEDVTPEGLDGEDAFVPIAQDRRNSEFEKPAARRGHLQTPPRRGGASSRLLAPGPNPTALIEGGSSSVSTSRSPDEIRSVSVNPLSQSGFGKGGLSPNPQFN